MSDAAFKAWNWLRLKVLIAFIFGVIMGWIPAWVGTASSRPQLQEFHGTVSIVGQNSFGLVEGGGFGYPPGTPGTELLHPGWKIVFLVERLDNYADRVLLIQSGGPAG